MATYPYECESCDVGFEIEMKMSKYDSGMTVMCPQCSSEETRRIFTVPYVNFTGDGWASKNNRIAGQMRDKNKRLATKEREQKGDGRIPSLAPNVEGHQTGSWAEATKLAQSKGKDTSGYEAKARKEKAGTL